MLLARVRRTVVERRLLQTGDRVLVACSGGPDSVVLTDVLATLAAELRLDLLVASVDHGLRAEAPAEVELAGALAAKLGLPFHPLRIEVEPGASIQARARVARYDALKLLAAAQGARRIAVGHTRDDQAETVLARMLRGGGLVGLSGIAPRRADGIVRPLIDCSRAEVRAHLQHRNLAAAEDRSNSDRRFERVRLRLDVLPALAAEDPRLAEHLADLADDARASTAVLRREARRLLRKAVAEDGSLDLRFCRATPPAVLRMALRRWAETRTGMPLGRAHLEALERSAFRGGEVLVSGGYRIRRTADRLVAAHEPGSRKRSSRNLSTCGEEHEGTED